jgi:hypothetical protein
MLTIIIIAVIILVVECIVFLIINKIFFFQKNTIRVFTTVGSPTKSIFANFSNYQFCCVVLWGHRATSDRSVSWIMSIIYGFLCSGMVGLGLL